ncbi:Frag1/DRAM/Sfk1 family-domain-containing protein [Mycena belliarum]|uniref:Frag1/DRAM/Sfk1 family-domain-containing protein n=1 Tax=Mycena belliarum TaxID=1033014 RepID=A0AAD6XTI0_9AGAR|nr:Frag1/DRAM/Sfk1 family-domain-containing protein [Mycena belliae]
MQPNGHAHAEPHPRAHWWYVWIPIFSAVIWDDPVAAGRVARGGRHGQAAGRDTVRTTCVSWTAYQFFRGAASQANSIAYISDVGADFLKPLFIAGCAITAVTFFLSLVVERYLRHSGRLIPTMRRREKVFSILAVLGSVLGGAGLVLLSIFDTRRHPRLHRVFLLLFMLGYRWLAKDYRDVRHLRTAYIAKGAIAGVLVLLAVAFGIALFRAPSAGAVLEWAIALGFTFYLLTFYYDLRQAKGVYKGQLGAENMGNQRRWAGMRQRVGGNAVGVV